jgi:hypothetical protein
MKKEKTNRGFDIYSFKDLYDEPCHIQKSSLATDDAIWFGIDNARPIILASKVIKGGTGWVDYPLPADVFINTCMHFNREQIAEIIPILQKFVDTGDI